MFTITQIILVFLGALIGFSIHGIISVPSEPEINIYAIPLCKDEDKDDDEEA